LEQTAIKQYNWKQPAVLLAVAAACLGLTGLSGWFFNSFELRSFLSDGATMKVNTSLIIICCGISMVLFNLSKNKAGYIFLSISALICTISLLEYITHDNWGIDQLFFKDTDTNPLLEPPGRPSVLTAINGLLVCIALFTSTINLYRVSQSLSVISFFIIYAALMGHLFGVTDFYRWGHYSGIAFHTALSLGLLNLSILLYQSAYGWIAVFFIKVEGRFSTNYFVVYLLFVLPMLISLYIFLINKTNVSTISATILVVIILAIICTPIFYIFLNRINIIGNNLSLANQRLEIALNAGTFGSYDLDLDTGIMTCSDQCVANFGLKPGTPFNFKDLFEAIVPKYREYVSGEVQRAIAEKKLYQAEYEAQWPDGSVHWINAFGLPQYNEAGVAKSIIGITYDITDRKEEELKKNAFIGMVSHELKTPLTSLKAYVQILNHRAATKNDEFETNALQKVERQVSKMTSMINSFLNVSRLESGQIYLDLSRFELDKLIQEIVEDTKFTHPTHEIKLNLQENIVVYADYDKIGQVINNLISNAIKYSLNEKTIDITCSIADNYALVTVKDKGMGIAEKYFDRVFERFYRVEDVGHQPISGFGIGLYLSAEIVRLHGGKIWVESELDNGAAFSFTLPVIVGGEIV